MTLLLRTARQEMMTVTLEVNVAADANLDGVSDESEPLPLYSVVKRRVPV